MESIKKTLLKQGTGNDLKHIKNWHYEISLFCEFTFKLQIFDQQTEHCVEKTLG